MAEKVKDQAEILGRLFHADSLLPPGFRIVRRSPRVETRRDEKGNRICAWCRNNLTLREVWRLGPDGMYHEAYVDPHPNRRYCSDRCRTQHNRAYDKGPKSAVCASCGKPLPLFQSSYSTAKYVKGNRKYCSVRCRVAAHRAKAKRKGKR